MRNMNVLISLCVLLLSALPVVLWSAKKMSLQPVVLENRDFRFVVGSDAVARSLVHKAAGQECLVPGRNV